jgi:hypothetical protein
MKEGWLGKDDMAGKDTMGGMGQMDGWGWRTTSDFFFTIEWVSFVQ